VQAAETIAARLLEDEPAIADALELALEAGHLVGSLVVRVDHRLGPAVAAAASLTCRAKTNTSTRREDADQDRHPPAGETGDQGAAS
jgi:hypothetical protein